jgi:hypothetical protein
MSIPEKPQPETSSTSGWGRRIAAVLMIGILLTAVLWYTVFSAVTAALVGSGGAVVLLAGSSASDVVETVLDAIANVLLAVLAAIGAVLAAIFSLFDF